MSRDLGNGDFEVGYVRGAEHEQERIIKLLEDSACTCEDYCNFHAELEYIISLIKGEQHES